MAKRAALTIILVGTQRTDRIDFDHAPDYTVLSRSHQASNNSDDPVIRIETALVTAPKPAKNVWILWEGASVQMLDLQAGVVDGLDGEQLDNTLSYEAEILTSVSAMDSAINGVVQANTSGLTDFKRFWIVQTTATLRNQIEAAVTRSGSKLAGIAHPSGLPRNFGSTNSTSGAEWRRIEVWDGLTFSLHGKSDGTIDTQILRSQFGSEEWYAALPEAGPVAWLGKIPEHPLPFEPEKIEFSDNVLADFLRFWETELSDKTPRVPAIIPASKISPNRKFFIIGGVASAAALTIILGHFGLMTSRISSAKNQAEYAENVRKLNVPPDTSAKEEQAITAQIDKLRDTLKNLKQQVAQATAEAERVEKISAETASRQTRLIELKALHRSALSALLTALNDTEHNVKTNEIVVKEVRQDSSGELKLTGLCRRSASADTFATQLENRLGNAGWSVGAAQKRLRDDARAFDFTVVLTPTVLAEQASPGKTPAQKRHGNTPLNTVPRSIETARSPEGGK